jgi:long-chain acyl-CoA synthetase
VTAGGKNVAPQLIENILKTNPYIANVVVVGDKRKFISALVVPDFDKLEQFAKTENISYADHEELSKNERVIRLIEEEIDKCTQNLASYERIKKIILLARDFHIDKGEMTPSFKVRRNIIEEKYKDQIDLLYQD